MEIYKDLNSQKSKEFAKLLNVELSKSMIKENQIVESTVIKMTPKLVWLEIPGSKAESTLDMQEIKSLNKEIAIGDKLQVLVENREDRLGNCIVSLNKAESLKNWESLIKIYNNSEDCTGIIQPQKIKGGWIVLIKGLSAFLPGSQVDVKACKNIDHLRGPQKFRIVKMDKLRGNLVVSRRILLEEVRNKNKDKLLSQYEDGQIIFGVCKGVTQFGAFFNIGDLDALVHINEISYSRITHPNELIEVGSKHRLKIINIDQSQKKISCSIKKLGEDPFLHKIDNYKVNEEYEARCDNVTDYGCFMSLSDGLVGLVHHSEMHHKKQDISPKNLIKVGERKKVKVLKIERDARRISLSIKACELHPLKEFAKKYPVKSIIKDSIITNVVDFGIFGQTTDYEIPFFIHFKDLSYKEIADDLKNFKKGDIIKNCQVLEINLDKDKVRCGIKQLLPDEFNYFKNFKKHDVITVSVKAVLDTGIMISSDKCPSLKFLIKKSEIALLKPDQRPDRYYIGDRVDVAISSLQFDKRKIAFSIRLLEKIKNEEAIKRFGDPTSGRSLPFFNLSKTLKNKGKK